METGFRAMRLGLPLFILPFIFVYDPALIMEGTPINIIERVGLTLIAIWAITSAFESWIYGVGHINLLSRGMVLAGGILIIVPVLMTSLLGAGVLVGVIVMNLFYKRSINAVSQ
jgi:TRAP-type uncharacterized transport system fused permease subunit